MSAIEMRRCAFCKQSQIVSDDEDVYLFKYSTRHYAHAVCMAKRFGKLASLDMIPRHSHRAFRSWLPLANFDRWDRARISVLDTQYRARRRETGVRRG